MFSTRLFIVKQSIVFHGPNITEPLHLNIYSPRCSFFQSSLDTPQFIGRDSVSVIVIMMGMGIKWSGSVSSGKKAEREESNLINRFQPISLCAQIIPSLDRDNTSHVICVTWDSPVKGHNTKWLFSRVSLDLCFLHHHPSSVKRFPITTKSFIAVCVDHVCGIVIIDVYVVWY